MKKSLLTFAIGFLVSSVSAQEFSVGIFHLGQNISVLAKCGPITPVLSEKEFANHLISKNPEPILEIYTEPSVINTRAFFIKEYQVDSNWNIKNLGLEFRNDSLVAIVFDFDPQINTLLHSYFGQPKIDGKNMKCSIPKEVVGRELEVEAMSLWVLWKKGNIIASKNRFKVIEYDIEFNSFSIRYEDQLLSPLEKCYCKDM